MRARDGGLSGAAQRDTFLENPREPRQLNPEGEPLQLKAFLLIRAENVP